MPFNTAFATDLNGLVFHGLPIAGIADAPASPLNSLFLGLATADPGPGGTQETNAMTYTGYSRIPMVRNNTAWVLAGNIVRPAGRVEFPEMTGGSDQLARWLTIGTALTGPGKVLFRALLSQDIACRLGVIPAIKADTDITLVTAS